MTFLTDTLNVTLDGVSITNDIISMTRDNNICSGIGKVSIRVYGGGTISPGTWEEIVVKENGTTKGTFYVSDYIYDAKSGELTINGQDNSKKLIDWYISEEAVSGGITYARTWIEYFLNQAGVSYTFTTVEQGGIVAPDTTFGFSSAYDTIISLLQMSGWYIYFNGSGTAIIGALDVDLEDPQANITESKIINIYTQKSDKMLRNRAVVWGEADQSNGTWVFADVSTDTPWNYDTTDKRTVVLANPYIQTFYTAYELANQLLTEFARLNYEKTVVAAGYYDVAIGDAVMINSRIFSGLGLVTGLQIETSKDGIVTTLELDRRCPRLFGYFSYDNNYVYAGTWGAGVWRKLIESTTWSDFSTGLGVAEDTLRIKDLFVRNGVFVCTSDDGYAYYRNSIYSNWTKFEHGILTDSVGGSYNELDVRAESCSINPLGEIIVSYNYISDTTRRAWVIKFTPLGEMLTAEQISFLATNNVTVDDVEAWTEETNIITATTITGSGSAPPQIGIERRSIQGDYTNSISGVAWQGWDGNDYPAFVDAGTAYNGSITATFGGGGTRRSQVIVDSNQKGWYFCNNKIVQLDFDTLTADESRTYTQPGAPWSTSNVLQGFLYRVSDSSFDIILVDGLAGEIYHWRYTGSSTLSFVGTTNYASPSAYHGAMASGNVLAIHYNQSSSNRIYTYDMSSGSGISNTTYKSSVAAGDDPFMGSDTSGNIYMGVFTRTAGSTATLYLHQGIVSTGGSITVDADNIIDSFSGGGTSNYTWFVIGPAGSGLTATAVVSSSGGPYVYINGTKSSNTINTKFATSVDLTDPSTFVFKNKGDTATDDTGIYDAGGSVMINQGNINGSAIYCVGKTISGSQYWRFIDIVSVELLFTIQDGDTSSYSSQSLYDLRLLPQGDAYDGSIMCIAARTNGGSLRAILGISTAGTITKELASPFALDNMTLYSGFGLQQKTSVNVYNWEPTAPESTQENNYVLRHTQVPSDTSASELALLKTDAELGYIYNPPKACKVEISKYSPAVIYSPPPSGTYYYDLTAAEKESFLSVSFTLESGAFVDINTAGNTVFDARVFDVPVNEQFYVEDGPLTGDQPERYVMLATGEEVQIVHVGLDESVGPTYQLLTYATLSTENTITLSGVYDPLFNHIESTNFILYPWMFVSLSGVISTDTFWQRGDVSTSFLRYSSAIPSGADITTIRTDDFI